ncbi:hypothetical protein WA026_012127 [Henosepilachna vigintioctopunctata]|uniref:BESS domain-containing protein n=1 Tax=Henosepilachna vigintioctopunctata TaxID=420089 RepID=A0AAW1VD76_9CUCU
MEESQTSNSSNDLTVDVNNLVDKKPNTVVDFIGAENLPEDQEQKKETPPNPLTSKTKLNLDNFVELKHYSELSDDMGKVENPAALTSEDLDRFGVFIVKSLKDMSPVNAEQCVMKIVDVIYEFRCDKSAE